MAETKNKAGTLTHTATKKTSPISNDISWYILISIRNSYSKISYLPKQRLKKNIKNLHLSLQSLDPVLAFRSSRHTSCRSSGRHAACLVWNWMAWGGHQLWVPSASSISFRFANQDMFVSFPILGNARGNVDFQAPSNACSPICGSDPYGYKNFLGDLYRHPTVTESLCMFTSCKRNIGAAVRTFIVWIWANFLFLTECFYTMHVQLLGSFKTTVTVLELEESGSPHWICICFLFNEEKRFTSKLGQTVGQPASYNV